MEVIRKEHASDQELRRFLQEKFDDEQHLKISRRVLLARLQELGHNDAEIELSTEAKIAAVEDEAEVKRLFNRDSLLALPPEERRQRALESIMAQGYSKDEADALLGPEKPAPASRPGERLPTGPEADNLWCTIRIGTQSGVGGDWPVPVIVNGVRQDIERNKDCEVRVPFIAALQNAERIVYDEKIEDDRVTVTLIPRVVKQVPLEYCSMPFRKEGARTRALT